MKLRLQLRYFGCAFVAKVATFVAKVATVLGKVETAVAKVATGPWTGLGQLVEVTSRPRDLLLRLEPTPTRLRLIAVC